MARILLSTNIRVFDGIHKDYAEYFRVSRNHHSDGLHLSTFHKLRVNTVNFREYQGGFIAISGTFFYANEHGASALDLFYGDLCEDMIGTIARRAVGNYAVIVRKDDCLYAFIDNSAAYRLYYYHGKGTLVVSNSLYHMAKNIRAGLSINRLALLESSFQFSILGEDTLFSEIRQVTGRMVVKYQIKDQTLHELRKHLPPCDPALSEGNIADAAKHLAGVIRQKSDVVTRNFGQVTLNLTGGLDSRLILASMLSNGRRPNIVYGVGNSPLTSTKMRDLEIVRIYAQRFGLELHQMDWTAGDSFREDWDRLLGKYGEAYGTYSGLNSVFREYEENAPQFTEFIEYGYYGETLRNVERLERMEGNSLSLDSLIEGVYLYDYDGLRCSLYLFQEYREYVYRKLEEICDELGIDVHKIRKDEFQRIHNRYREKADTRLVNLQNAIVHSAMVLADQEVQGYSVVIPYEWKRRARFMLRVINELSPDVLDIPVFSHRKDWVYDRSKGELKEINGYTQARAYLEGRMSGSRLGSVCRRVKTRLFRGAGEREGLIGGPNCLRETVRTGVAALQAKLGLNLMRVDTYEGDIRKLMLYYQNLYLIDKAFN